VSRLGYLRGSQVPTRSNPTTRPASPWRVGRILAALAALALLVGLGYLGWHRFTTPTSLSGYALTGARGPACQRIIVANDVSGSMGAFSDARRRALADLLGWAPANLRPTDEIGVLDFAGNALWSLPPTSVTSRPTPGQVDESKLMANTFVQPVFDAVAELPASPCRTSVWLLSDAQFGDYPASEVAARDALAAARIDQVQLLVPSGDIDVAQMWETTYPYAAAVTFDGTNPDETALTYGTVLARLTGQELTPVKP